MSKFFRLKPGSLSLNNIEEIINKGMSLQLDESALAAIKASSNLVETIIEGKKTVYGINTGFGSMAHQRISKDNLCELQKNLVLSHACGTGELLDDKTVSMILLLKINSLSRGYSGVRQNLIEALIALFNAKLYPCIPAKGSVGASGDLAPLAHLALPLLGVGNFRYKGKIISAEKGLSLLKMEPIALAPKEGLALLNGLQASTALALKAYFQTTQLFESALVAGALSVDAASGSDYPFDARIQEVRLHQAQKEVAAMYRSLLQGSEIRESHKNCQRVQDPYSLRCQPQIMGAILHQLKFIGETLSTEANAVSDNPLVFTDTQEILSGGNFHGEIIAMTADNLAISIAEIGAASERRIALLIDKNFSYLPAFLVKDGGLNSGFMIAHVSAAACASDNKALAHPHSVDSLPTSANQEDHVSMATNAALRLYPMLDNTATILAIEFLAACQGLEFHKPLQTSPILASVYARLRAEIPAYDKDRYFAPDLAKAKQMLIMGKFIPE